MHRNVNVAVCMGELKHRPKYQWVLRWVFIKVEIQCNDIKFALGLMVYAWRLYKQNIMFEIKYWHINKQRDNDNVRHQE